VSAALKPGTHTIELSKDGVRRTMTVNVTANQQLSQFIEMPKATAGTGDLQVRTDPAGAKVIVDGQARGVSPVNVQGLTPGNHVVVLQNDLGSVNEDVTIQPGATASLVVPLKTPQGAPVSGWISIAAPAELQVFESDRLLGTSRTDRIMVAAGRHEIEVSNEALGYRTTQTIQVAPGGVVRIRPDWPMGTIAINATPWANVTLDGKELGETPVGNTSVPIGTHEVIFKHPQLGEQRFTATVTANTPARLSVDMRKK
jgi:serine/threonine-protein kinase